MKRYLQLAWIVCALFACAPALADERILSFHSDIRIEADGSLLITETIRVRAEGRNIRRGLYRTFPTNYRDRLQNVYRVRFDVLGLTRDGQPEPWNAYGEGNGVRVDFGDDDFLRVPAEYEYALQYRTNRTLGFFATYDELYWNVNGLDWDFPVDSVSATVTLPVPVPAMDLAMEGYTGGRGATGRNYTASVSDGVGTIRTTTSLGPNEGLTLSLAWPKGVIVEPTQTERATAVLADNRSLLFALAALLGSFGWLLRAWRQVGRDPDPGVIFPHYEPPDGYSPAAVRYVTELGYDQTAFTAALIDLAVKGHMRITENKKTYVLTRVASPQPLTDEDRALSNALFSEDESLMLVNKNHAVVSGAQAAHAAALKAQGLNRYWRNNTQYLVPSFLGSLALFGAMFMFSYPVPLAVVMFGAVPIIHIVFGFLLRAPTPEGRKVMDRLDGFKLYLDVAEKEELNLRNPPQLTPQLFEKFLPFAIALGVEQAWGKRFERALALMPESVRSTYHPIWYTGHFNPAHTGDFTKNVSSSFSSAIASAATAPGTSTGHGGGGFSGGGGGGGGGGGR